MEINSSCETKRVRNCPNAQGTPIPERANFRKWSERGSLSKGKGAGNPWVGGRLTREGSMEKRIITKTDSAGGFAEKKKSRKSGGLQTKACPSKRSLVGQGKGESHRSRVIGKNPLESFSKRSGLLPPKTEIPAKKI